MKPPLITQLRDMVPIRALTPAESLRVAELQATWLLRLSVVEQGPVHETVVTGLPRIQAERHCPSPSLERRSGQRPVADLDKRQ